MILTVNGTISFECTEPYVTLSVRDTATRRVIAYAYATSPLVLGTGINVILLVCTRRKCDCCVPGIGTGTLRHSLILTLSLWLTWLKFKSNSNFHGVFTFVPNSMLVIICVVKSTVLILIEIEVNQPNQIYGIIRVWQSGRRKILLRKHTTASPTISRQPPEHIQFSQSRSGAGRSPCWKMLWLWIRRSVVLGEIPLQDKVLFRARCWWEKALTPAALQKVLQTLKA